MGSTIVHVFTFILSVFIAQSYDVIFRRLQEKKHADQISRTTEGEVKRRGQKSTQKSGPGRTKERKKYCYAIAQSVRDMSMLVWKKMALKGHY